MHVQDEEQRARMAGHIIIENQVQHYRRLYFTTLMQPNYLHTLRPDFCKKKEKSLAFM